MTVRRGPQENITYEIVLASPVVSSACFVCLIWMVLEMRGRWLYSCCFVGCSFQNLFNKAHSLLVQFLSSFFSIHLISVHVVHPYSRIDTIGSWKKLRFILTDRSDLHMINNLSITVHAYARCILTSFSKKKRKLNLIYTWRKSIVTT